MSMIIGTHGMKKIIKKKNILVLGANGMLGSMVYFYFENLSQYNVIGTYNKKKINNKFIKFDAKNFIFNTKLYKNLFDNVDYIINCIGLIKPDTINNKQNAININSLLPHILDKVTKKKCFVFQINTDCVFSGNSKKPYTENCEHDPLDVYGKTKSLGEISSSKFINVRTSIIGPEPTKYHKSLFEWFISQKSKVNGFADHFWNGITTYDFARIIGMLIRENLLFNQHFHVSFVNKTSKYNLLSQINKIILNNEKIVSKVSTKSKVNRVLSSDYQDLNKKLANYLYEKDKVKVQDMLYELNTILYKYYRFYKK